MLKTMRITTSNSKQSKYIFFFYHFMSTTFCSYQLSKSSNRFSLDGLAQSFVQAHLTLGLYENHTGLLIFLYQFWAFAVNYELASGPDFELKLAYILTLILDRHDSGLDQSIGPLPYIFFCSHLLPNILWSCILYHMIHKWANVGPNLLWVVWKNIAEYTIWVVI